MIVTPILKVEKHPDRAVDCSGHRVGQGSEVARCREQGRGLRRARLRVGLLKTPKKSQIQESSSFPWAFTAPRQQ